MKMTVVKCKPLREYYKGQPMPFNIKDCAKNITFFTQNLEKVDV